MKVLILTFGTRGDVQPFVALAQELRDSGHDAVLAAPERFAAFAGERDIPFAAVDDTGPPDGCRERGGRDPDRQHPCPRGAGPSHAGDVHQGTAGLLGDRLDRGPGAGADLVVHNGQIIAGQHIAERLDVPVVLALTLPMYVPTREFPWPGQALPQWLPAALNRATFLGMKTPVLMFGRTVDHWREHTLSLPRRRDRHDPLRRPDGGPALVLNAVSRHVLPPPADWPRTVVTTGYWFLPQRGELSGELAAFLASGEPPVFVGFGSMAGSDPARTTELVLAALAKAGVRAVLATGWGGLTPAELPEGVIAVEQVPHASAPWPPTGSPRPSARPSPTRRSKPGPPSSAPWSAPNTAPPPRFAFRLAVGPS